MKIILNVLNLDFLQIYYLQDQDTQMLLFHLVDLITNVLQTYVDGVFLITDDGILCGIIIMVDHIILDGGEVHILDFNMKL